VSFLNRAIQKEVINLIDLFEIEGIPFIRIVISTLSITIASIQNMQRNLKRNTDMAVGVNTANCKLT
jgi:hypothetical protein